MSASTIHDLERSAWSLLARLWTAGAVFVAVFFVGAAGYHTLGDGRWLWSECLYMAMITLSTVGFSETLPGMDEVPYTRAWTGGLIFLGSGSLIYFASSLTAMVVEGEINGAWRRRRMSRQLDRLKEHVIVCGAGTSGIHILQEFVETGVDFVVIERSEERVERLRSEPEFADIDFIIGDANDDHVLERAGIHRAKGLISALHGDRDNLFVVVTARALSEDLRIVAKAVEFENVTKLERAGADAVVAGARIGGVRLADEMTRPSMVQFLDSMLADREEPRRFEEIQITAHSHLVGKTLAQSGIRDAANALVMAVRDADGHHTYNPRPDTILRLGTVLVVLVRVQDIPGLLRHVGHPP